MRRVRIPRPRSVIRSALLAVGATAAVGVRAPAAPDSGQPQLTVSDGVLLSWIERSGARATLKFAERIGTAWSEPRAVTSGEDLLVNWADVPSVMRLADGTLAAHWLQTRGAPTAGYDVRLSYSTDNGKTGDGRQL